MPTAVRSMHICEVRLREDNRGVDLISACHGGALQLGGDRFIRPFGSVTVKVLRRAGGARGERATEVT